MGITELREEILRRLNEREFERYCSDFKVLNPSLTFDYEAHISQSLNYEDKIHKTLKRLEKENKLQEFAAFLKKKRRDGNFEFSFSPPSSAILTEFPLSIASITINPDSTFQNIGLCCGFHFNLHKLTGRKIHNLQIIMATKIQTEKTRFLRYLRLT